MHKILAYLLICLGLALMFMAFNGMYQTFVRKKPVVQLVQPRPLALNTQYGTVQLDVVAITQVFNLSLFALFMIFLVSLGGKLVSVGSQLLKTERICDTLQSLRAADVLEHEKEIQKL